MVKKVDRARLADARHEAAHAVVSWLLGHRCLAELNAHGGRCEILNPDCPDDDQLLIALAPLAATGDLDASWHDLVDAVGFATALNAADPMSELRSYHLAAANLFALARIQQAWNALGENLSRRGRLGPDAVDRIIGETFTAPLVHAKRRRRPRRGRPRR